MDDKSQTFGYKFSKVKIPTVAIRNSYCSLENFPQLVIDEVKSALTYKDEEVTQKKIQVLRNLKLSHAARKSGGASGFLGRKLAESGSSIESHISQLKAQLFRLEKEEMTCLLLPDGRFPTGLLGIVKEVLSHSKSLVNYDTQDLRVRPDSEYRFKWKREPHEMRYYQQDMAGIAEAQERGVFESCVGSGKTLVMLNIVKNKRVTTLIVEPSLPLISQTKKILESAFGKSFIEVITTVNAKKKKKFKPIRLVTVQTLASLLNQNLLSRVLGDVQLLLLDEFHHAASNSYTELLPQIQHIYYRYGFTGTFLRNDCKTLDLWGVLSQRLYHYPPYKAIEEGFITPVEFKIHKLPGINRMNYQKEYEANYCGSAAILKEIHKIIQEILPNEQILVLVDRKDKSGLLIHEYLENRSIANSYVSGDDKKGVVNSAIEEFNSHKIRILIGSTVLGEGMDIQSTQHLILATGGKSEIKIVQAIGRGVRLHPGKTRAFVHDFLFEGTRFLERHLEQRLAIYANQFAGEVKYV
jgi:superfamily II DNA or RNA helicase